MASSGAAAPPSPTVIAFTEVHNRRSRAVMERLGMSYRGEIRRPGLVEGIDGIVDDAPFALYTVARDTSGRRRVTTAIR